MNGASTDNRAAACAGTQFSQGHPHRHDIALSFPTGLLPDLYHAAGQLLFNQSAEQSVKFKLVNQAMGT
jgi:hypothetical protein